MIKKLHKFGFAVLTAIAFSFTANAQGPYTFSTDGDREGWAAGWGNGNDVTQDDTEGVTGDGALKLIRSSNNSNIGYNQGIDADTYKYIKLKLKNNTGATSLRVQGSQDAGNTIKLTNQVVAITPNLDEYVVVYVDLTGQANWSTNNFLNLDILVRENYVGGEDPIFFDEIEFLATTPADEFSEFLKNPNFEDTTGVTFFSGNKAFGTRSISAAEAQNGDQSLKLAFSADQDATWWTFSSYTKTYGTTYPIGTDLEVKMWVKTNRTGVDSEIKISGRVKLTDGGVDTATKPITTVTTTNTAGEWEQITITMTAVEAFDGAQFWFAVPYGAGDATNLLNGDVIYLDNMTATVTSPPLSSKVNTLEGVSVSSEDGAIVVDAPAGSETSVYSITGAAVANNSLASGVYIVKVVNGGKFYTTKVIVE